MKYLLFIITIFGIACVLFSEELPEKISSDYVTMNSVVEVFFSATGKSRVFKLVYPEDVSLADINLSVLSPLGCALLGSKKGKTISFYAPEGLQELTVRNILYQPEANGEDIN